MTPTLKSSALEEIEPSLVLSNADLIILKAARGICKQARDLTTKSIDDDSMWADAQLALDGAIQAYKEAQA